MAMSVNIDLHMTWKPDIRLVYYLALVYRVVWGNIWIRAILIWGAVLACLLGMLIFWKG